jgi:N4-gp56 family major capsid protein
MPGITDLADVTALTPELWGPKLFAEAEKMTFWGAHEGPEGSSMPIIRKDDLEKTVGDKINIDAVAKLTEAGLTGDVTVGGTTEGNEEELRFVQQAVTVDTLRKGVLWTKLGKIMITHDMRATALRQLRKWLAGSLDESIWTALTTVSSYPGGQVTGPGGANATTDIQATDVLTLDYLVDLKAFARVAYDIEPIRLENGEEFYGLAIHPYAKSELKKTADWKQAQREARERSSANPIFTGAIGVYDGVILYEADKVPKNADGASSAPVARNVFFGAAACLRAFAYLPDWSEQYFSYGEKQGIATFLVKGEKLNVFDFSVAENDPRAVGSMLVLSSAPTPSV